MYFFIHKTCKEHGCVQRRRSNRSICCCHQVGAVQSFPWSQKDTYIRAKVLQNGFCADFWVGLRGFFPDSEKSKALLRLGLPQLGLSRFHVIMLRCIHLEFARQCDCHGQIVNLLYLLILLLSQTVEPQGLLDCSSVGFGLCFPAFLKYCHVSVFSRGMLALGSVLHVHPGCTHSNNMCKMLLKRVFFPKLGT